MGPTEWRSAGWSTAGDGARQVQVLHLVRPAAGGMVRHLQTLLPALAARGLRVAVAGPSGLADAFAAHGEVRFLPVPWTGSLLRRPWSIPALRRSLAHLLAELKPGIVHLHGLEAAWVGLPVCRRQGVRVCVTLHNELPGSMPSGPIPCRRLAAVLVHRLVRWLAAADAVILVSPAMLAQLAVPAAGGEADDGRAESRSRSRSSTTSRFHLIPNGIDLTTNAPLPFPRTEATEPLRIAIVSRLSREKGVDLICPALRGWKQRDRPLEVRIAGDGPWGERLRHQVDTAGLGGEVKLLGRLTGAEVRNLLGWAELLLLPSRTEGLPLAILEAMAAGRPVVASRVGGIPWLVRDGVDGWLVEPGRPESLRRGLELAWAHRSQLATMGAKARQRVAESYSADRMIARTLELYRCLQPQSTGECDEQTR
ncbi:MAG: glycosyltransferase family 4 protein [Limnochordales bacterium]|nr:glycosyltransferase family 4 protein [Limnochordales bacterium]